MDSFIRRFTYMIESFFRRHFRRFESILRRNTIGRVQGQVMRKQADADQWMYRQQDKVLDPKKGRKKDSDGADK